MIPQSGEEVQLCQHRRREEVGCLRLMNTVEYHVSLVSVAYTYTRQYAVSIIQGMLSQVVGEWNLVAEEQRGFIGKEGDAETSC